MVVAHGKRRTPIDNRKIDIPLFSDIIGVVSFFVVNNIDPGKVGLGKETLKSVEFFRFSGDFGVLFDKSAVALCRIVLCV